MSMTLCCDVCYMYVIYVSMHDVHVIFDALNCFYDEYDVCMTFVDMMMFSMLNMPYDVVCHIASRR